MRRVLVGLWLISALVAGCRAAPAHAPGPAAAPKAAPVEPRTSTSGQAGDMNVLLLGTDKRLQARDPSWRTDTLIVVAVRPKDRMVAMFSIPRDLWVDIPGHGQERINVADYLGETRQGPGGGPALIAATLQENLGIPVHAYVRIDFEGLKRIVDALGGVTVNVERPFNEVVDEGDGTGQRYLRLEPGSQHMDGRTALAYARTRRGTNDMDRSRRQQQVLLALRDAALQPGMLPRLPGLVGTLANTVETDLNPSDAMRFLNLALRVESYRGRVFDYSMVRDWVTPGGAMVLLPNRERITQVWAELTAPGGQGP